MSDTVTQNPTPAVSDDPVVSPAPVAVDDSGAKKQSPLDLLDQILNEAQSKANQVVADKVKEEEAEHEAERQRQIAADQQKIEEERQAVEAAKQSPQYQAWVEQKTADQQQAEQHQEEMQGMQIVQIQHKKIPVAE